MAFLAFKQNCITFALFYKSIKIWAGIVQSVKAIAKVDPDQKSTNFAVWQLNLSTDLVNTYLSDLVCVWAGIVQSDKAKAP